MIDINSLKEAIWNQFGAGLDMLENALNKCPEQLWDYELDFWYIAYHCLFWTDYYLTLEPNNFQPPIPFTFSEFDPSGRKPDRIYTKQELLNYLEHSRTKAKRLIEDLTLDKLNSRWINDYKNYSLLEILLYNLRHIQHHTAQLNLLLRQSNIEAPNWVSRTS